MRIRRRGGARLLAGAIIALAITHIAPATGHAIADGQDVEDGRYEFSVALSMPSITRGDGSTYASACGGVLIAPHWILSAGHCFHDGDGNRVSGAPRYQVTATIGQATLSGTTGSKVDVVNVMQHPNADIAAAKLAEQVTDVEPIAIASTAPEVGDVVRLTGWGSTDGVADLSHRPDRMQTGQMTVTRVDATQIYVTGKAPKATTSACPYDSGSPYFTENGDGNPQLVATVVGGPSCPHANEDTAARANLFTVAGWARSSAMPTERRWLVPGNRTRASRWD